jgi:hypothetical protein
MSEFAAAFEMHAVIAGNWKREMLEPLPKYFDNKKQGKTKVATRRRKNSTVKSTN